MASDIKVVFKTFISMLGKDAYTMNIDYSKNIKVYFITSNVSEEKINAVKDVKINSINDLNQRLKTKNADPDIVKEVTFKLLNLQEKTFNKDTFEESEYSYQHLLNDDVKKYLFPKNDAAGNKIYEEYLKKCNATGSIDYNTSRASYNGDKTNKKYQAFINDYNITSDEYNSSEYFRLGVKEDQIIENEIVLECDDLQYFETEKRDNATTSILSTGVYGFVLAYVNNTTETPMILYKFARPTYSNYNKIKIAFNANGLFGVI